MTAPRLAALLLSLLPAVALARNATPIVFWHSDSLKPGDAVLLFGDGLAAATSVKIWPVAGSATATPVDAPPIAVNVRTFQPVNVSVKFLLPASFPLGVYAALVPGGKPVLLNRPQISFLQPEVLAPGLTQNQTAPGAKFQVIGKDFLLPGDQGKPAVEIRPAGSGAVWSSLPVGRSEKFSLHATLPASVAAGNYELRISNGYGGEPGWSDPLAFTVKAPDVWPSNTFDVKKMGAKGDDITDDTAAIRAALDAAQKNGGGVVYFPWGTYRLTDWVRIPPKTILRGEERDASILKWPLDDPQTDADFKPAAVYGDTSYGIENLTLITRKVNAVVVDLSSRDNGVPELKGSVEPEGSHDVFLRHVSFQNWMHCEHPDRLPSLWASRYTDGKNSENFDDKGGAIENFEITDCLFQGGNQAFYNLRNARISRNSFSNGMGYCWTCLGGGAWNEIAEDNNLNCSSSWGYGSIGMQHVYSAHNVSHNFVHGEREAMTLDISATPATPYAATPHGIRFLGKQNVAWYGSPKTISANSLTLDGIKADKGEFVGKVVFILDGPGTGQFRTITANTATDFTLDRPWDVPPTPASVVGVWDLMRDMVVYDCEGCDTSAFAQLYGSFYDYIVDSCKVDRSQGIWGQSGWFVQFRYNTIHYGFSFHPRIGEHGPNREGNAPFGYTGLTDGNLRVTKFGSAQYSTPGGKAIFVKDVAPHPVPGARGCIIKGNELEFNQRIAMVPSRDPAAKPRKDDFVRMTDVLIDGNTIQHSAVGIWVGGTVTNSLLTNNHFKDVATPVTADPVLTLTVPTP